MAECNGLEDFVNKVEHNAAELDPHIRNKLPCMDTTDDVNTRAVHTAHTKKMYRSLLLASTKSLGLIVFQDL